jgi:hypothetical protein
VAANGDINGRVKIPAPIVAAAVAALLTGILSATVGYVRGQSSADLTNEKRITTLEIEKQDILRRLDSIEHKLDELLRQGRQ